MNWELAEIMLELCPLSDVLSYVVGETQRSAYDSDRRADSKIITVAPLSGITLKPAEVNNGF